MTTFPPNVLTAVHIHSAPARTRRRATVVACAMAVAFALHQTVEGAPIKFEFETTTAAGDPFGYGWFRIDDATYPYPHVVIGAFPATDVFLNFHYADPHLGVLRKEDVASVHFEIGVDPLTHAWLPTISLWAFNIANPASTRFLTGSLDGSPIPGVPNTISYFRSDPLLPWESVALVSTFPTRVPEPMSVLLFGTAAAFLGRRHFRRR